MADIRARKDAFLWTDDEVELLLRVALDYKTTKVQESFDWESCKSKYSDIGDTFQVQDPRTPTDKDFPHDASVITKVQFTAKIKHICSKYRQAVDTGRWSGQGRVVLLFFELCEEVWGGSPATCTISSGIETGDLEESSSGPSSSPSLEGSNDSPQPESSESNITSTIQDGFSLMRELIHAHPHTVAAVDMDNSSSGPAHCSSLQADLSLLGAGLLSHHGRLHTGSAADEPYTGEGIRPGVRGCAGEI
ncbi:hypothetical protein KUCAC02_011708 [Chaenocephalus aceratus]|uniref:Uncharacterized protein n=1 Tax=Chaenocephalus aceratus TaxID=36190 RepID=A0ACB9WXG8_CHAAC|nr:hypothetical protein KUCAC02_011708 [Chaenocephalus aceratus]